jgi:phage repressor protein C with HTH and peptisase S24 domain
MLPVYRDGDLLIVSPSSNVRRQDRVVLKKANEGLEIGVLLRRTAQRLELQPFDEAGDKLAFNIRDVEWLSRIVWASQ